MRQKLMQHQYDILIIKDLSRFSRRNGCGQVELETLRDQGIRFIAIGDNVDIPTHDDWFRLQFRFLINEIPVVHLFAIFAKGYFARVCKQYR